jgi:hypothetical protein
MTPLKSYSPGFIGIQETANLWLRIAEKLKRGLIQSILSTVQHQLARDFPRIPQTPDIVDNIRLPSNDNQHVQLWTVAYRQMWMGGEKR